MREFNYLPHKDALPHWEIVLRTVRCHEARLQWVVQSILTAVRAHSLRLLFFLVTTWVSAGRFQRPSEKNHWAPAWFIFSQSPFPEIQLVSVSNTVVKVIFPLSSEKEGFCLCVWLFGWLVGFGRAVGHFRKPHL